jgi:hypothetical protein
MIVCFLLRLLFGRKEGCLKEDGTEEFTCAIVKVLESPNAVQQDRGENIIQAINGLRR